MNAQSTLLSTPQPAAFDWILHPGLQHLQEPPADQELIWPAPTAPVMSTLHAPLLRRLHQQSASTPNQAWLIAAHLGDTERALRELGDLRPSFAGADSAEHAATERMIRLLQQECQHGTLSRDEDDAADGDDVQGAIGAPWRSALLAIEVAAGVRPRRAGSRAARLGRQTCTDLVMLCTELADARYLFDRGTFGRARVRADEALRRASAASMPLHTARAQALRVLADSVVGDTAATGSAADDLVRLGRRDGFADILLSGEHAQLLLLARNEEWEEILCSGERLLAVLRAAPRAITTARIALDIVEASAMVCEPATSLLGELLDAWEPNASELHEVAYLALLAGLGGGPAGWLARSAVRTAERHGLLFDAARLQLSFASVMAERGDIDARLAALEQARHRFARAGARDWARLAEAHHADAQQAASNLSLHVPLTDQEARVATLAASGMTNKQIGAELFLSPRTVSGHLYRVFPKLGITTRAGLRDALTAAGVR